MTTAFRHQEPGPFASKLTPAEIRNVASYVVASGTGDSTSPAEDEQLRRAARNVARGGESRYFRASSSAFILAEIAYSTA